MNSLTMPERQDHAEWRQACLQHMREAPADHAFFWLLDSCAHKKLPGLLWELEPHPEAWPLYMNTYLEEARDSGPFLVRCGADSRLTLWALHESAERPLGILLELRPDTTGETFQHLQNLVECLDPQGHRSIFRFYDPRILYAVTSYAADNRLPLRVLGPALRMTGWEPGRCVPVSVSLDMDSGLRCSGPEQHDEQCLMHIWDENRIHTTIGTLGGESGITLRAMPLPEAYRLVEEVCRILSRHGYLDRRSLAYGTSVTVRCGLEIWTRPDLREALEVRHPKTPLSEILEFLDI